MVLIGPLWAIVSRFGRAVRRGMGEPEFRGLAYLVSVIVASGTVFYRFSEGWPWVDSIYFTVITLTTVGYGDIAPETTRAKVFTIVLILIGIGLLVSFIERVARYAAEDQAQRRTD